MSVTMRDLGDPIATGRTAVVHVWPLADDMVVKLFPAGYPVVEVHVEHAACTEASRLGFNLVHCRGEVTVADPAGEDRAGLLFDRVHGDSLTRQAERDPRRIRSGARILAQTHARMHQVAPARLDDVRAATLAGLDCPPLAFLTDAQRARARAQVEALPDGDRLLHLDFHTENVFSHDGGYAVIDWQTAKRGEPAADAAATVLLIRDVELWPGTPLLKRAAIQLIRRTVLSSYLTEYRRITGMTQAQIDAWRVPALVLRMATLDVASERGRFQHELRTLLADRS